MGTTLLAMTNETRKGLLIMWDYKFNMFIQLITLGFVFIGIGFFMGGGKLSSEQLAPALLGYLVWFYAIMAISNMSWELMEEAQTGTLEQMCMGPASTALMLVGRACATLISTTIMMLPVAGVLVVLLDVSIPMRWEGLPVIGLTLFGLFGFGFMIGGATIVFKHVESLANLAQNILLFLNGALLPVDALPPWLTVITKGLPTTQGIIVLRNVVLGGQSLGAAWADGSLGQLMLHSLFYFCAGWLIFAWCERIARRQGTLGQY